MRSLVGWKDAVYQYYQRFRITDNEDGTKNIVREPGTVTQEGTSQNAANFNKMDFGVLDNELAIRIMMQHQMQADRKIATLSAQIDAMNE